MTIDIYVSKGGRHVTHDCVNIANGNFAVLMERVLRNKNRSQDYMDLDTAITLLQEWIKGHRTELAPGEGYCGSTWTASTGEVFAPEETTNRYLTTKSREILTLLRRGKSLGATEVEWF